MDVDLRKLRYFVAVAEELHFGRAATRLHIAQPVLSRQIRALEAELGVPLLYRDRRSTALAPAGSRLLEEARPLLAAAETLRRRVREVAHGTVFTIGFMPGITTTVAARAFTARHPELSVDFVQTSWDDQTAVVREGRVDVSFIRLPVDLDGLRVRRLFTEPRVAALPADHPLAGRAAVTIADLAGERLLQDPSAVPEWPAGSGYRGGHRSTTRPAVRTVEEKVEQVAAGNGIVVLPRSVALAYPRPDIVRLPVTGIAPHQVCLAWSGARSSPLIEEFAEIALDCAAG
ncbi:LysR family transcriptional regulator [Kitasatospora sp. HPMI-4]|uniref:LysR family transcriptional regulator n=1 Tax=Kitasatospora sp. HPMI-4 TaxID=3448443 RepID=UPI003F1E1EF5